MKSFFVFFTQEEMFPSNILFFPTDTQDRLSANRYCDAVWLVSVYNLNQQRDATLSL